MHIFKEPTELSFDKVGIMGKVFPINGLTNKVEFVIIESQDGHETTIIEHASVFTYYVLEGEGYFLINDIREECSKGDLVVIPADTKFTYKGKLKLLLSCCPPWKEEQEETLNS